MTSRRADFGSCGFRSLRTRVHQTRLQSLHRDNAAITLDTEALEARRTLEAYPRRNLGTELADF